MERWLQSIRLRYFQSGPTKSDSVNTTWLSFRTGLDDVTFYKSNHAVTCTKDIHLSSQLSPRNIQAVILLYLKFNSTASFEEKLSIKKCQCWKSCKPMQQKYFISVALNQFLLSKAARKKHFSKVRLHSNL